MEEVLQPLVEEFVTDQRGFYRDHASDEMLVALLMWRLSGSSYGGEKSRAEMILEGDPNAAYDAACPIFERILEHGARAGGNGHHRAQHFAEAMSRAGVEGRELRKNPKQ